MTIFFILLCCWVGLEEERVCKHVKEELDLMWRG